MESLDQLNNYSAKEFETWLSMQLQLVHGGTPEKIYRAFDFRHLDIPRGESHLDALQGLFDKLSTDAKERFRNALERILRHAKQEDFSVKAIADVVTLVGLTEAYGSFPAFVAALGSGAWGETQPSLIYDALSVLMMFEKSNEAYETAKGLATSTYFPNALVFDAYLVMVRSRPENWRDDLVLLRDRFNAIIQEVTNSADARKLEQLNRRQHSLSKSLAETVPFFDLGRQLATLKFAPTASHQEPSDDWLYNNLLQPSGSVDLMFSNDIDGFVIVDRTNPARMAKVETTSSFEVVCISRGLVNNKSYGYPAFPGNAQISTKSSVRLKNALGETSQNRSIQPIYQEAV